MNIMSQTINQNLNQNLPPKKMILGGMGIIQNQVVNELVITPDTAEVIANAFSDYFEKSLYNDWVTPVAAVIVSAASLFVALKAYQITRQNFVGNIQKIFFEIMAILPHHDDNKPLTKRQLELMTNYMEYVCDLYYKGSLKSKDIEIMTEIFKNQMYIDYVKQYRKNNVKFMSSYWRWLEENNIV